MMNVDFARKICVVDESSDSMRYLLARITRLGLSICLLAVLLLVSGCHSFNHEWKKAAQQAALPNDIEGRWQGIWKSDASGHTDQLRCIITKTGDGDYKARFHAKYHRVMSFGYTVPLKVQSTDGEFKFSGDANLGWMAGGKYHYEGHANSTNFFSTYKSKYDHGIFQMGRP
jgi:hypothetical protein